MLSIEPFISRHFQDEYSTYGNPVTDLRVNCPFCVTIYGKPDYKHKLHVSLVKQVCHCFRCGYKKSWVQLVQDLTKLPYAHALGELYVKPRASKFKEVTEKMYVKTVLASAKLPSDFMLILNEVTNPYVGVGNLARTAHVYLTKRGFTDEDIYHYNLGVSQEIGYRVVIPIEADYWQARAVYDFLQPKYMAPEVENRHYLFNAPALDAYDEIVICEGAFSAIAVGKNAVATLSHNITKEQMQRLKAAPVTHYIIASEPGFLNHSYDVADELSRAGKHVTIWDYQEGDPAEPGKIVIQEYNLKNKIYARLFNQLA